MRPFIFSLKVILLSVCCHAQKKEEINLSEPIQLDSNYFMFLTLVDHDNQSDYGKGKGYLPYGHYSNISFYNAATNQSIKLFKEERALIMPFFSRQSVLSSAIEPMTPANFLASHIVYLVRTDNYNGDHALDTEDPLYLYISDRKGEQVKQITPKGLNVLSWSLAKNKKMILVKVQTDTNGNKKFGEGDDQSYYRIDLDEDVSKIKCYPLSL